MSSVVHSESEKSSVDGYGGEGVGAGDRRGGDGAFGRGRGRRRRRGADGAGAGEGGESGAPRNSLRRGWTSVNQRRRHTGGYSDGHDDDVDGGVEAVVMGVRPADVRWERERRPRRDRGEASSCAGDQPGTDNNWEDDGGNNVEGGFKPSWRPPHRSGSPPGVDGGEGHHQGHHTPNAAPHPPSPLLAHASDSEHMSIVGNPGDADSQRSISSMPSQDMACHSDRESAGYHSSGAISDGGGPGPHQVSRGYGSARSVGSTGGEECVGVGPSVSAGGCGASVEEGVDRNDRHHRSGPDHHHSATVAYGKISASGGSGAVGGAMIERNEDAEGGSDTNHGDRPPGRVMIKTAGLHGEAHRRNNNRPPSVVGPPGDALSAAVVAAVSRTAHHQHHPIMGGPQIMVEETGFPTAMSYAASEAAKSDAATVCSKSDVEDIDVSSIVSDGTDKDKGTTHIPDGRQPAAADLPLNVAPPTPCLGRKSSDGGVGATIVVPAPTRHNVEFAAWAQSYPAAPFAAASPSSQTTRSSPVYGPVTTAILPPNGVLLNDMGPPLSRTLLLERIAGASYAGLVPVPPNTTTAVAGQPLLGGFGGVAVVGGVYSGGGSGPGSVRSFGSVTGHVDTDDCGGSLVGSVDEIRSVHSQEDMCGSVHSQDLSGEGVDVKVGSSGIVEGVGGVTVGGGGPNGVRAEEGGAGLGLRLLP